MNRLGRLYLDATPGLVLACCRDCPSFRDMARTRAEAWAKAAAHAHLVHDDEDQARHAQKNARRVKGVHSD